MTAVRIVNKLLTSKIFLIVNRFQNFIFNSLELFFLNDRQINQLVLMDLLKCMTMSHVIFFFFFFASKTQQKKKCTLSDMLQSYSNTRVCQQRH